MRGHGPQPPGRGPIAAAIAKPVALLFALWILLALAPAARAQDPEGEERAIVSLTVNGVEKEEITVVVRGGEIWIAAEDLERAGLRQAGGERRLVSGRPMLELRSLRAGGQPVRGRFDERELALHLDAAPAALGTTTIDMGVRPPRPFERRGDASAFFNYAPRLVDLRELSASAEAGVSADGHLLYSAATASENGLVRGPTHLTVDDRPGLRRLVVGDAFVTTGALGAGMLMGGVTYARHFPLDPYFATQPTLDLAGAAAQASTLDVYVNGALVRSEALPPGAFRLENLPQPTGAGTVRYVLRDAFGRERSFGHAYYMPTGLLAPGVSDWSYTLGFARLDAATKSFHYGTPGALGRYRVGLNRDLTAGLRLEAAHDRASGGGSATVRLPTGQLEIGAAASAAPGALGVAGLFTYGLATRAISAGITARATSDGYATLSLDPSADRSTIDIGAFTSVAASSRVSIGAQYTLQHHRDAGLNARVGMTGSVQVGAGLNAHVGGAVSRLPDGSTPKEVSATLTWAFGPRAILSASQSLGPGGPRSTLEASTPLPRGPGVGGRASATFAERASARAVGQAQTESGRYQATVDVSAGKPHLLLEAAGGIAWVAGAGTFLTRPVEQGFAVMRVPGAPGVRGYLDNQEIGRTDEDGDLLVPGLLPYHANRLRIADEDLPADFAVESVERAIAPAERGGALVDFPAKPTRFFRGRITLRVAGLLVAPAYGELRVEKGREVALSPLSKLGDFELEGVSPGRYRASVEHEAGTCSFFVDVPRSSKAIADLGQLVCTQRP